MNLKLGLRVLVRSTDVLGEWGTGHGLRPKTYWPLLDNHKVNLRQGFSIFLFHRPSFTVDTSFSPTSPIKQTQGNKLKKIYLKNVLNSRIK